MPFWSHAFLFNLFCSTRVIFYLADLLSLRLVGARNYARSSFSQRANFNGLMMFHRGWHCSERLTWKTAKILWWFILAVHTQYVYREGVIVSWWFHIGIEEWSDATGTDTQLIDGIHAHQDEIRCVTETGHWLIRGHLLKDNDGE